MMTDSKSDEPEDLIEPLPGNKIYLKFGYELEISILTIECICRGSIS